MNGQQDEGVRADIFHNLADINELQHTSFICMGYNETSLCFCYFDHEGACFYAHMSISDKTQYYECDTHLTFACFLKKNMF